VADLDTGHIDAGLGNARVEAPVQPDINRDLRQQMWAEIEAARERQKSATVDTASLQTSRGQSEYNRAWAAAHFGNPPSDKPVFDSKGLDTVDGTTQCGMEGIAKWGFGVTPKKEIIIQDPPCPRPGSLNYGTVCMAPKEPQRIAVDEKEDPLRNNTTPCDLFGQWATGNGPRTQKFTNGDPMTEELRRHDHIQHVREEIPNKITRGQAFQNFGEWQVPVTHKASYNLGGWRGVKNYTNDSGINCMLRDRGCERGNLAVAYLGSYKLDYKITSVDAKNNEATVVFHAENESNMASATHPPIIGYKKWWKDYVGDPLNEKFQTGPMSTTKQEFYWVEKIPLNK
jgi:hypothetical protein